MREHFCFLFSFAWSSGDVMCGVQVIYCCCCCCCFSVTWITKKGQTSNNTHNIFHFVDIFETKCLKKNLTDMFNRQFFLNNFSFSPASSLYSSLKIKLFKWEREKLITISTFRSWLTEKFETKYLRSYI